MTKSVATLKSARRSVRRRGPGGCVRRLGVARQFKTEVTAESMIPRTSVGVIIQGVRIIWLSENTVVGILMHWINSVRKKIVKIRCRLEVSAVCMIPAVRGSARKPIVCI
jgi:hypothetical protein